MRSWLAKELAIRDHSLTGFWPLIEDGSDWSGFGHNIPSFESSAIPTSWNTWYNSWLSSLDSWNSVPESSSTQISIEKICGRSALRTGPNYQYAIISEVTDIDGNLRLNNGQPFSVSFWFRPDQLETDGGLLSQAQLQDFESSTFRGWEIYYDNGDLVGRYCGTGSFDETTFDCNLDEIPKEQWANIVVIFLPENVTHKAPVHRIQIIVYINGRRIGGVDSNFGVGDAPTGLPFIIGASPRNTSVTPTGFKSPSGAMDLVRFYSRELFEREIRALYEKERRCFQGTIKAFGQGTPQDELPLFVWGHDVFSDSVTLLLEGGWPNDYITLYTEGGAGSLSETLPLFVYSPLQHALPLFISGPTPTEVDSTGLDLFLWGSTAANGFIQATTLVITGEPKGPSHIPLYISGPNTDDLDIIMPLFISGEVLYPSNSLELVIFGTPNICPTTWEDFEEDWDIASSLWDCLSYVDSIMGSVFLRIENNTFGIDSGHIPLHIRHGYGESISLYVCGPPVPVGPENISLMTSGCYGYSDTIQIFMTGTGLESNPDLNLYVHGF